MEKVNKAEGEVKKVIKGVRLIDSQDLFKGAKEILIKHGDKRYTLKITRTGKLILN